MAITIMVERSKPILMNKIGRVRKGSWDWTTFSDAEMKAELDRSYIKAQKDIADGKGQPAEEFFKEFKAERAEWFTR